MPLAEGAGNVSTGKFKAGRSTKRKSSGRRFKRSSQFKAPAIPATAPPAVPKPPIGPPTDFASQYTTGLVAFNALPEIVSRASQPFLQFLVNRGPQFAQRGLLQRLGPQLGAGAARIVDTGIMRGAPLLMLSGLGPQPRPGIYGIPEGGTPEWRAKYGLDANNRINERVNNLASRYTSRYWR
jgi:hypothetical protein